MSPEELREALHKALPSLLKEHLEVGVDVTPQYAQAGDGHWSQIRTTVTYAGVEVYEHIGEFDLANEDFCRGDH
jgi:hypothetical protein